MYRCDQFFIEHWLGKEALGEYVMGRKLPDAWCFVPGLIITTLYPQLEKSGLGHLWSRCFRGRMILGVIFATLVMLFQDSLFTLIYAQSLPHSATVMSLQFWIVMFTSLSMLSSRYFLSINLQRHLITRTLIALIINVIMNLFLIPKYGIIGAAIATLISEGYMATVSCWWSSKTRALLPLMLRALNPLDRLRS
jgi:PST family polysaccharide transporter